MKWCCFRTTMCHFMPCSIVVANQPVICHYVCPCIRQAGSNIRRTLKHQHKDCSHETQFSETHHWWNNWSLSEGCLSDTTSRKAPVQGGGTHESTEGEKVTKSWADRAGDGSESGHCVFESSSWDPDDRVVFGNLRARAQKWAFPPTEDWARKEGFGFQSIHSFIYITYFHHQDCFKGRRELFSNFQYALASVFYFPALCPTMYLFPEQHSPGVCV